MSTNISLSCYQKVHEHALSGYQNVNEHLTIRLPTCQRTAHYPVIKMSTNISLCCYQNVNEYSQKLIKTKINEATIFTLAVRTQYSGGETTSFHMIQLIANMKKIKVQSEQSIALTTWSRSHVPPGDYYVYHYS